MIESAAVVFPHPDSPASPRDSPSPRVKSTPSTALTIPAWVSKYVRSPLTSRRARESTPSTLPEARVQDFLKHVADHREREDEGGDADPGRQEGPVEATEDVQVAPGVLNHLPPARGGGIPEAEEREKALREDGIRHREDRVCEDEGPQDGEHVARHDVPFARPDRTGALDVPESPQREDLGPHDPRGRRPAHDRDRELARSEEH